MYVAKCVVPFFLWITKFKTNNFMLSITRLVKLLVHLAEKLGHIYPLSCDTHELNHFVNIT